MIRTIHNPARGKKPKKKKRARGRVQGRAIMAKKKKKKKKRAKRRNPANPVKRKKRRSKKRRHASNPSHAPKKRRSGKKRRHGKRKKHRRNPDSGTGKGFVKSLALASLAGVGAGALVVAGSVILGIQTGVDPQKAMYAGAAGAGGLGYYLAKKRRLPLIGVGVATGGVAAALMPMATQYVSDLLAKLTVAVGGKRIGAIEYDRMQGVSYSDGRTTRALGQGPMGEIAFDQMSGVDPLDVHMAGGNPY